MMPLGSPSVSTELLGECTAPPTALLVHNPVAAGAFRTIDAVDDDALLESQTLFRARPIPQIYAAQHDAFVAEISACVGKVIYLADLIAGDSAFEPAARNPNLVFTRDSLITIPWLPRGYFRARLKPTQRRQESRVMQAAVEHIGLCEIVLLPNDVFLEGGDVIPFAYAGRRCLLIGYGPRSSPEAVDFLQQTLLPEFADELIAIRLASWRMNLDGGFVPVADDVIVPDTQSILAAEHIDSHGRSRLNIWQFARDLNIHVIDTMPEESVFCQSCNCLCLGERTVVYYDLCPRVASLLEEHDINVRRIPGSELIKGRGGPRCMTRPIYLSLP